jgi:AcrR family transcriptional regulator
MIRASRRTLQKEATRDHLYTAALRLFEERGYEQVNIDDIVRAADVARGTFYFHFPRKDDVLIELIRRSDRHIVSKMAAVGANQPLLEALQATTDGFADVWADRRALLPHAGAVGLRRIAEVSHEREQEPLRIELVKHVAAAVAAGELRSPLPAQMLADVFLLDVFAALMAWAMLGPPPPDLRQVMGGVIELFLHGARGVEISRTGSAVPTSDAAASTAASAPASHQGSRPHRASPRSARRASRPRRA